MIALILAMMLVLAPDRELPEMAGVIAHVVETSAPLFVDDEARRKTAAIVVSVAFRESSFRQDATSKTHDFCLMQVHRRPDLLDDLEECLRVGLEMIRVSMRMCPKHPLAFYAEGPRGCTSTRAQRISRDRFALAAMLAKVQP